MVAIIRLSYFIFMLMFGLLEARDPTYYKHNYQGILDTKVDPQSKHFIARDTQSTVTKEIVSHVIRVKEEGSDTRLKGRKLATNDVFNKKAREISTSTMGLIDGRSSKISGRNRITKEASGVGKSQAVPKDKNSKDKTEEVSFLSHDHFQKLDSHDLEATNEVWTLMNKDYLGYGKAHHNPPINNR